MVSDWGALFLVSDWVALFLVSDWGHVFWFPIGDLFGFRLGDPFFWFPIGGFFFLVSDWGRVFLVSDWGVFFGFRLVALVLVSDCFPWFLIGPFPGGAGGCSNLKTNF